MEEEHPFRLLRHRVFEEMVKKDLRTHLANLRLAYAKISKVFLWIGLAIAFSFFLEGAALKLWIFPLINLGISIVFWLAAKGVATLERKLPKHPNASDAVQDS